MNGAEMIAAERRRQVEVEGYSIEHDVVHEPDQQLAVAAWCYLGDLIDDQGNRGDPDEPPEWPWPHYGAADAEIDAAGDAPPVVEGCTWKPTPDDPIRQLVKAGALIAAEIDRLIALGDWQP